MGAICGKEPKRQRPKQPYIVQKGPDTEAKTVQNGTKEQAPVTYSNPPDVPTNVSNVNNKPQSLQPAPKNLTDSPEKYITEEDVKDQKYGNGAPHIDMASQDNLNKLSAKGKIGSLGLDQTVKGQSKALGFDGKEKSRSTGTGTNNVPQTHSIGNVDHIVGNMQPMTENNFEVLFAEKETEAEDYYLELNEIQMRDYSGFLNSSIQNKQKSLQSLNTVGGNKLHSHVLEWSKLLQKVCIQENAPNSPVENENKLLTAYEGILKLDERNWYEEMVLLYKEKNFMSKNTANMTGLTFDRKIIQLQEQFKWFVSAVANMKLNFNNLIGVHEFPAFRAPNRFRKSDKLDSSNMSGVERQSSMLDNNVEPEFSSPKHPSRRPSTIRTQIGGLFGFRGPSFEPRRNFYQELPDAASPAWQEGFIWKGVFLKLYSKREGQKLKREFKTLKHLGVEYLQTEAISRIIETRPHSTNNISDLLDTGKQSNTQIVNLLLPLMCTIESSSWILLGTPIFPIKKSVADDQAQKVVTDTTASTFKNSFLLSGLTNKNFKIYHKAEETQPSGIPQANPNTTTGPHSSYLQGTASGSNNNIFLLLTNVSKTLATLPKVNIMFILNQEPNAHVTFLEFSRKKAFDPVLIKRSLGYATKEIDLSVLYNSKKPKTDIKTEPKGLFLDVLHFKRRGWMFQMIYVDSKEPLPPSFCKNKRAYDLLTHSRTKSKKEIKGNVLIFAYLSNKNSIIHPYFISEQFLQSTEDLPNTLEPLDTNKQGGRVETNSVRKSSITQKESFAKESFLKHNFKYGNSLRDEKALSEYFGSNVSKSIDYIVNYLENTDNIINFAGLKELFHRKGLNMRFEWIILIKVQRSNMKALIGADILARGLKKLIDDQTSIKHKYFRKIVRPETVGQKEKIEEFTNEKNEFLMENFTKTLLAHYLNMLIRNYSEMMSNLQMPKVPKGPQNIQEILDEETFFDEMNTELFLGKMRLFDFAKKLLTTSEFDSYLSTEIIKSVMNVSCLHAGVFLNAVTYHMRVSINYEILKQLRNDKYNYWISKSALQIKAADLNIIYHADTYLTISERCYILLLKILPTFQPASQNSIELVLPSALYKLRKRLNPNEIVSANNFDCFLRENYELPDLEILNDWIVLLESALNGLYTQDGQQNFLTEAYLLQLILAFFGEGDYDNQLTLSILERVSAFLLNSPVSSPELCITIYTWFGILLENKLIAECEQNYLRALLILHRLYGDPRGRGGQGTPWELFITWRLSILSRLQSKTHDAEYCEELFDATLVTLKDNPLNSYLKSHYIYNDPFKAFYSSYSQSQSQDEHYHLSKTPDLQKMDIKDHPFSYWTSHLTYSEASSKVDVINSTLQKTPQMLKWMLTHMPTFQHTGILWNSANLRDFYLYILQSSFNNSMSISSISSYSMEKGRDRSIMTGGLDGSFTPKSRSKHEKRDKAYEQAGNLVQMIEKDVSTFNKKEINGVIYAWGQNNDGQVGTPAGMIDESSIPSHKKIRIYYPKGLLPLKDTIIVSVSCGHTHSMAITLTRHLLAWGSNKSLQLGLGDKAPSRVYVPTLVPNLKDVQSVSCGSEHTVALTAPGVLYSWGQGEGGLLGHGDTNSISLPKKIEGLKNVEITSVVCGGLHTLAISKQGACYSWGRAEGGQLGLPFEELIHIGGNNELFLTTPKRLRGALESVQIVQVACGDAHSLALSDKGQVFGWGYTNSGQLGLGVTGDNFDPSAHSTLQVKEPVLIERLGNMKVKEIFAGSTFSLFLNEKKELYGCGLNDYNQLGIEKSVTKINNNLEQYRHASFNRTTESPIPKLIDCFTYMPILNVACGENHSLALVFFDSYYMLFAWGMQRHGQLGIGDIQQPYSTPRPISFLQYVMTYSMACGAYHSLVVLGEAQKNFKKEALIDRLERKAQNKWSSISLNLESSYEAMIDQALVNLDSIIPSEEGKIDNPKAIKKAN